MSRKIVGGLPPRQASLAELIHPSDRQREFLESIDKYKYILYGGAKGGGKSYILRWALVRMLLKWAQLGHRNVRVGLFCEDYPALKDRQITKVSTEFPSWLGRLAESSIDGMSFRLHEQFGSGLIAFRNLDDPSKFASSEFACVAVDELTKNPKEVFDQFRSIIRWPGIDDTKFIAGSNPGGRGHEWVKRLWIDREFDLNEPEPEQFKFIQAFAKDNPHLSPVYVRQLEGLPEQLRKAYLDGSWDLYEGQFFNEWRNDRHVVDPYQIPDTWRKFRTIDHGRTAPTACSWIAVDQDGRLHVYREYYKAGVDADINAENIAKLSGDEEYAFTLLDSACFSKTGAGETIAEIYERNGVSVRPWPKNRHAGWVLFHEYLRWKEEDGTEHLPKLVFFSGCKNAIRTIPSLVFDENDPEDLDTTGDDHVADNIRGALEYLHESKSKGEEKVGSEERFWRKHVKNQGQMGPRDLKKFYSRGT